MRIKIMKPGIYGADGEIAVGEEFTVKSLPKAWEGKVQVISGNTEGKTAVVNPADKPDPVAPFKAEDAGSGWWVIKDANGQEVGKKMRAADAAAFNELSDKDKAEFIKTEG